MGELADGHRHGRAPARRADGRRAHRCRRARLGSGGRPATCPTTSDLDDLGRRLNKLCAPAIAVRDLAWVDDGFDARFSATCRHYRYDVWNGATPNPLLGWTGVVRGPAAGPLGAAGRMRPADRRARLRVVLPAAEGGRRRARAVARAAGALGTLVRARRSGSPALRDPGNAFCHQMVRSIVGTLVDVGLGKASPGDIRGILVRRDRDAAGQVAPPYGLVLWEVGYRGDVRSRRDDPPITRAARGWTTSSITCGRRATASGKPRAAVVESRSVDGHRLHRRRAGRRRPAGPRVHRVPHARPARGDRRRPPRPPVARPGGVRARRVGRRPAPRVRGVRPPRRGARATCSTRCGSGWRGEYDFVLDGSHFAIVGRCREHAES